MAAVRPACLLHYGRPRAGRRGDIHPRRHACRDRRPRRPSEDQPTMSHRHALPISAVTLLALLTVACSDDSSDVSVSAAASTPATALVAPGTTGPASTTAPTVASTTAATVGTVAATTTAAPLGD